MVYNCRAKWKEVEKAILSQKCSQITFPQDTFYKVFLYLRPSEMQLYFYNDIGLRETEKRNYFLR